MAKEKVLRLMYKDRESLFHRLLLLGGILSDNASRIQAGRLQCMLTTMLHERETLMGLPTLMLSQSHVWGPVGGGPHRFMLMNSWPDNGTVKTRFLWQVWRHHHRMRRKGRSIKKVIQRCLVDLSSSSRLISTMIYKGST